MQFEEIAQNNKSLIACSIEQVGNIMGVAFIEGPKVREIAFVFYHAGRSHCSTCGIKFLIREGRCEVKTAYQFGSIGVD